MTTTKHLIDFASVNAPELEERNETKRTQDLELSHRIGLALCLELGIEVA